MAKAAAEMDRMVSSFMNMRERETVCGLLVLGKLLIERISIDRMSEHEVVGAADDRTKKMVCPSLKSTFLMSS